MNFDWNAFANNALRATADYQTARINRDTEVQKVEFLQRAQDGTLYMEGQRVDMGGLTTTQLILGAAVLLAVVLAVND